MIEVLILCVAMYILYIYCEIQDITVKFGSVLITHDKKPPGSPQPGGEREVTGRVKSPASHLSSSPGLKAQKKPQDRKKNKKNKPVVDIPPTPKERGVQELKEALVTSLMNTL